MENRRNYYRILQIQHDAPFEVIRASYYALLRELKQHPDLGGDHWNATILNEAYRVLSDGRKRAKYDNKLFNYYTKRSFASESSNKPPVVSVFCPSCKQPIARNSNSAGNCIRCKGFFQSANEKKKEEGYKRSVIRLKRSGELHYFASSSQTGEEAQLVDISTKGMRFRCKKALNLNMIIKIASPYLNAVAKVIHVQQYVQEGKKLYSVGINFQEVAFNDQEGSFFSVSA